MQLAAETGGKKLEQFAAVAGISASSLLHNSAKMLRGAPIAFISGLQRTEEQGISAIKVLDDMGITEVRMRAALLRAAGAGDLFAESIKLGAHKPGKKTSPSRVKLNSGTRRPNPNWAIMRNKLREVAHHLWRNLYCRPSWL